MGTVLEITVIAPDEITGQRWIDGCFEQIDAIERLVSRWEPESMISRLNRSALEADARLPAGPTVIGILSDAKRLASETDGAFDVTVGPLIALWREQSLANELPDEENLATTRSRVGTSRIILEEGFVTLTPGTSIDLGGLAKGWALEQVESWLREQGADRALLNFGGSSLLALGTPLDAPTWRVLVGAGERRLGVLSLSDAHASVSASLGQTYPIGAQQFGHVIDPRTGWPVSHEVVSIAIGTSGATAEAWSTALLVRGAEGVIDATTAGVDVMVVDGGSLTVSDDFPDLEWLEVPSAW